jgi:flagella basal body P-ring formation protein FlgA
MKVIKLMQSISSYAHSWLTVVVAILIVCTEQGFSFESDVEDLEFEKQLNSLIVDEISRSYVGAKIQLESPIRWIRGIIPNDISSVRSLGDDGRGNFQFIAKDETNHTEAMGLVSFYAWYPARVALRRIHPDEELKEEMFVQQNVDGSRGMYHEMRNLILSQKANITGLESIQSVIEGHCLTSAAVRKIPDIKRGDGVQIHLLSGGLVLSTSGVAEERGYIKNRIKVRTLKSKRELSGLLRPGGVVEVSL